VATPRLGITGGAWSLIVAATLLTVISIALIYSATHASPETGLHSYHLRQLVWFGVSLLTFGLAVAVPLRLHEVLAYVYYGVIIILLVALIVIGSQRLGAQRWFSLGFFNFQPSELAKVVFVIALARYLSYSKRSIHSPRKIFAALALAGLPTLLILRQPDLGTSIAFLVALVAMLYWARLPSRYLVLLVAPVFSVIASSSIVAWVVFFILLIAIILLIRPNIKFSSLIVSTNLIVGALSVFAWNQLQDYQKMRIKIFLDPGQDPLGAGYQIIQSKVAIGSGGILGKGYLAGSQSQLDFLPLRHTDFVFSVAAEEFGLLGAAVILILFSYLLYRGILIALKTRNRFASLVAVGATSILGFQMFVNIGMVLGLMPVTGLPLPFVSYGGSSMLTSWLLIGLLVNVDRTWQEY
jgi:rod shape determining protein RodA